MYEYSMQFDPEKTARSQGFDLDASYKDLCEACNAIRGKPVAAAIGVLDGVVSMQMPIRFRRFSKHVGHRSQLGGKKGRFPRKEARLLLALLENAVANAGNKGLDESKLVILQARSYKQNTFPRYRRTFAGGAVLGYGKNSTRSDYVTARVELVVGEAGLKQLKRKPKAVALKELKTKAAAKKTAAKGDQEGKQACREGEG